MARNRSASMISLLFLFISTSCLWAGEPVQLRILYINDFHGFAESYQPLGSLEKMGGIANLAGEVRRLRKERPTLVLAAGDMIQGNPWANLFAGKSTIEVMNAMDFSAMVLGNHEFDFGQEVLKKRIMEARFPILAANVQGLPMIKSYLLQEIAGLNIAIIGLITEDTPTTTHPKNVEGLKFTSMIDSARKAIQELGGRADLVIILSHLGLPADRRLAESVKGIQVIVGGHTQTRIESPMKVNETLIVQAWEHAKVLGVLDLTVADRKVIGYEGKLITIGPERQPSDPAVEEIVERYKNQTAAMLDEVVGEALVDLQGKGSGDQETNLGNLVTDILRQETKADVAMTNSGSIRADILKGPIRIRDLMTVLPFSNHPVVLKVKGQELKRIFEYGLTGPDRPGGGFPQVSGIRLTYTPEAPEGQRIKDFQVAGKPLDLKAWYSLATIDFLAAGGDGYIILKNIMEIREKDSAQNRQVLLFDSSRTVRDLVIDYIKSKNRISASVEGRIRKE